MLFEHRLEHLSEFFVGTELQILVVEPFALFVIELGTGFGHTVEREILNQLVHRVHLLIA